jgi:hypothetical protein
MEQAAANGMSLHLAHEDRVTRGPVAVLDLERDQLREAGLPQDSLHILDPDLNGFWGLVGSVNDSGNQTLST